MLSQKDTHTHTHNTHTHTHTTLKGLGAPCLKYGKERQSATFLFDIGALYWILLKENGTFLGTGLLGNQETQVHALVLFIISQILWMKQDNV